MGDVMSGSDCRFVEFDVVNIPAGEFWMGSDPVEGEDDGYLGQLRHKVCLPDYIIQAGSSPPKVPDSYRCSFGYLPD